MSTTEENKENVDTDGKQDKTPRRAKTSKRGELLFWCMLSLSFGPETVYGRLNGLCLDLANAALFCHV